MNLIDRLPRFRELDLYPEILDDVDIELAIKNRLLFTNIDGKVYAVIDPESIADSLNYYSKLTLKIPVAVLDKDSFERLYHRFLELKSDKVFSSELNESESEEFIEEELELSDFLKISEDILTSEESAPIIKFVNALFYQAVKKRASDIHIESHEDRGVVRFRIDGILLKHSELDKRVVSLVISRIKVISNLDISERRIPQDGRTQVKIAGKTLDVRVSILPTYHGERAVMRILMESEEIPSLEELGFEEELTKKFKELLSHTYGMILVTGPTGSGKSTTLHAFLQNVATEEKNIITIEDPVEYKSENINQIQVNPKVGLTFASGLRSILRQDPDVILVGEIRDKETAQIAVQAALTGHLLLSTLHTNNAASAITRLMDMGIEQFLITSSLLGVLSQRLVRKLCSHCKEVDESDLKERFSIPKESVIYKAKGCAKCNYTGYIGRSAVGELFLLDEETKNLIKNGANENKLREYMKKRGYKTLPEYLKEKVINQETSLAEAIRVGLAEEIKDAI